MKTLGAAEGQTQWYSIVIGEVEDAMLDLNSLEQCIGGGCDLSSVRTSLNDAVRVLHEMRGE